MRNFRSAIWILAFSALAAVGCGDDVVADPVDCGVNTDCGDDGFCVDARCTAALTCEQDGDCGVGAYCDAGDCLRGCLEDGDCGDGRCDAGRCVTVEGCTEDADCAEGEVCSAGVCEGVASCADDAGCPMEFICKTGACIPGCRDETKCLEGDACRGGLCVPAGCTEDAHCAGETPRCDAATGQCVACLAADDCTAPETCIDRQCLPQGTECDANVLCSPGNVCVDGYCLAGCADIRDCPEGLLCDPAQGERGLCVECLETAECADGATCLEGVCAECAADADCAAEGTICEQSRCVPGCRDDAGCAAAGEICDAGACRAGCRADADCDTGLVCDPAALVCVTGCTQDADCGLGRVCDGRQCVEGCHDGRDCPEQTWCDTSAGDPGLCVEGCDDPADCPTGAPVCDVASHTCVQCLQDTDCEPGMGGRQRSCDERVNACAPACATSDDCPRFGGLDACNETEGVCVECLTAQDCDAGQVCNASNTCVACATDADCAEGVCDPAAGACVECLTGAHCASGVCDPAASACVQCLTDGDCDAAAGETCDPNTLTCLSGSGRGLCEPCSTDAQCGGAGDLCVVFTVAGTELDRGCGLDCSAGQPCPAGYACTALGSGRGQQCVPTYDNQVQTCQALRTIGAGCALTSMQDDETACGVSSDTVDDADCHLTGDFTNPQMLCTVRCQPDQGQCPEGMRCAVDIDGVSRCR